MSDVEGERVIEQVVRFYRDWEAARRAERAARARFVAALRPAVELVDAGRLARALGMSRTRVNQIVTRSARSPR